jgi:hypothetical protein
LTVGSPVFGPQDLGRFLRVEGSSGGNDSALISSWANVAYLMSDHVFPLLAPASPSARARYGTPPNFGSNELLPPGSEWSLVVGAGSNPFLYPHSVGPGNSGLLRDIDRLSVSLGSQSLANAVDVADSFYLNWDSQSTILGLPTSGGVFSIGCRNDYEGCESDTVAGVEFETTDAPVSSADQLYFPSPVSHSVRVRCSTPNSITVTVPAAYMQFLANSGATRIRTTFTKSRVVEATGPNGAPITISLGHGMVGFTTR